MIRREKSMICKFCALSMLLLMVFAGFHEAAPAGEGTDSKAIIERRSQLMRRVRDTFEPLRAMLMAGELEILIVKSTELHEMARDIEKSFAQKALADDSRARSEIWSDWEDFRTKAGAFAAAVAGVRSAAQSGDAKETNARIDRVTASCKSCHRSFRRAQPEAEDEYQ